MYGNDAIFNNVQLIAIKNYKLYKVNLNENLLLQFLIECFVNYTMHFRLVTCKSVL